MRPDAPFREPWQAQAFALAVALNERGHFTWKEWAETFAPLNDGTNYWSAWLTALERILERQGKADDGELSRLFEAWREAADRTPHGEPIVLGRLPFREDG